MFTPYDSILGCLVWRPESCRTRIPRSRKWCLSVSSSVARASLVSGSSASSFSPASSSTSSVALPLFSLVLLPASSSSPMILPPPESPAASLPKAPTWGYQVEKYLATLLFGYPCYRCVFESGSRPDASTERRGRGDFGELPDDDATCSTKASPASFFNSATRSQSIHYHRCRLRPKSPSRLVDPTALLSIIP